VSSRSEAKADDLADHSTEANGVPSDRSSVSESRGTTLALARPAPADTGCLHAPLFGPQRSRMLVVGAWPERLARRLASVIRLDNEGKSSPGFDEPVGIALKRRRGAHVLHGGPADHRCTLFTQAGDPCGINTGLPEVSREPLLHPPSVNEDSHAPIGVRP